ncbi:hypothetical protein OCA08_06160 [Bacillus cereus]|nr:hypothetical protein [Bacillus cereus]
MYRAGHILTEEVKAEYNFSLKTEETFIEVLRKEGLNIEDGKVSKAVMFFYAQDETPAETEVAEVSELLEFGENVKVVLTIIRNLATETKVSITKIWDLSDGKKYFKEYSDNELMLKSELAIEEKNEVIDEIKEYFVVSDEGEMSTKNVVMGALTCIIKGACCTFEGIRYNHCGQYCGNWEKVGGGKAINALDQCCFEHDRCLVAGYARCGCHKKFLQCSQGKKGPGHQTIKNGIAAALLLDRC